VLKLQGQRGNSVDWAREYVEAMLGFEVYARKL
jgi:hypothetical protein